MLNSDGNENGKKNKETIAKKNKLCMCSTLFVHNSLSLFCMTKT